MKHYKLSGPVELKDIPEATALRLKRIFGEELKMEYTGFVSDRPLYRKPTEAEIENGEYRYGGYVRTTAEDGDII